MQVDLPNTERAGQSTPVPANGIKTNEQEPREKSGLTGKEMYMQRMAKSNAASNAIGLKNLKIGALTKFHPKEVAYIRLRFTGAQQRVNTLNRKKAEYSTIIRAKAIVKTTEKHTERTISLVEHEVEEYRAKKFRVMAQLIDAKEHLAYFEDEYESAIADSAAVAKQRIAINASDKYAVRKAASTTAKVLDFLSETSKKGLASTVETILKLARERKKAEVRDAMMRFFEVHNTDLFNEFTKHPKLLTKVVVRVIESINTPEEANNENL